MKNAPHNVASTERAVPWDEIYPPGWTGEEEWPDDDRTCTTCKGDGMHPIDDCMPCPDCDGEGYEWWN